MIKQKQNYIVDFRVTDGDVENVFNVMKEFQKIGIADKKSKIEFNGITVPAGYLDSFEQFMEVYEGIDEYSHKKIISALPAGLSEAEVTDIILSCHKDEKSPLFGNQVFMDQICAAEYAKSYMKLHNIEPVQKSKLQSQKN